MQKSKNLISIPKAKANKLDWLDRTKKFRSIKLYSNWSISNFIPIEWIPDDRSSTNTSV